MFMLMSLCCKCEPGDISISISIRKIKVFVVSGNTPKTVSSPALTAASTASAILDSHHAMLIKMCVCCLVLMLIARVNILMLMLALMLMLVSYV